VLHVLHTSPHPSWFNRPNNIRWSSSVCNFSGKVLLHLSWVQTFLSALCSNTKSIFSLWIRYLVSHSHRTTVNIIVFLLIFRVSERQILHK
jgi:vacuolar-type H+-ATPase subunit I/STV1